MWLYRSPVLSSNFIEEEEGEKRSTMNLEMWQNIPVGVNTHVWPVKETELDDCDRVCNTNFLPWPQWRHKTAYLTETH